MLIGPKSKELRPSEVLEHFMMATAMITDGSQTIQQYELTSLITASCFMTS
jgi:hypothetical protein